MLCVIGRGLLKSGDCLKKISVETKDFEPRERVGDAQTTGAQLREGFDALQGAFGQMGKGFEVVRGKLDKKYKDKCVEDAIKAEWKKYDARHAAKPRIVSQSV